MKNLAFAAALTVAVAFLISIVTVNGDFDVKKCKKIFGELTKRQLAAIASCTKQMNFKSGKEKADKALCIMKCVMVQEKILDANGMVDEASAKAFNDRIFGDDEGLKKQSQKVFGPCYEQAKEIKPNDEFCKSYGPMLKCVTGKALGFCTA